MYLLVPLLFGITCRIQKRTGVGLSSALRHVKNVAEGVETGPARDSFATISSDANERVSLPAGRQLDYAVLSIPIGQA